MVFGWGVLGKVGLGVVLVVSESYISLQIHQDHSKLLSMQKESYDELMKKKVWLSNDVSQYLTTPAISLIEYVMNEIEIYASLCVMSSKYHVTRSMVSKSDSLIPRFHHAYIVQVEDGVRSCSCMYHECNGLPCAHMAHVLKKHDIRLKSFSKYDVSKHWWSAKLSYIHI